MRLLFWSLLCAAATPLISGQISNRPAALRSDQETHGQEQLVDDASSDRPKSPKTRARAARAQRLSGTPWTRLMADLSDYRRFRKAVGRFTIFDAEGQRRSVEAGGLSAFLSQTWLPSYHQRAVFQKEHSEEYKSALKFIERTVQSVIARSPLDPPPLTMHNKPRGFGAPFDFRTLIDGKFIPLLT